MWFATVITITGALVLFASGGLVLFGSVYVYLEGGGAALKELWSFYNPLHYVIGAITFAPGVLLILWGQSLMRRAAAEEDGKGMAGDG